MKKYFILQIIALLFSAKVFSQSTTEVVASRSAFIEAGGTSIAYTFNYDFRFNKQNAGGAGLRFGIGGYAAGEEYLVTLPVMYDYLAGTKGHYFEGSAGLVMGFSSSSLFFLSEGSFPVAGCIYAGYRSQPVTGGFVFRAGIPFFFGSYQVTTFTYPGETHETKFFATPLWPGVSVGFAF